MMLSGQRGLRRLPAGLFTGGLQGDARDDAGKD